MTHVFEVHYWPQTVGDTQNGMMVCYNSCVGSGNNMVAAVTYMRYGTSADCSQLMIVPYPGSETVEEIDCNFQPRALALQDFLMLSAGGGAGCPCGGLRYDPGTPVTFDCTPLPTEETTWGRIKALYR